MSELTAFKVAFLTRCAEEGLTLDQINDRVKTAVAKAEAKYGVKEAGAYGSAIPWLVKKLVGATGPIGRFVGIPTGLGIGVGAATLAPKIYDDWGPAATAAGASWLANDGDLTSTAAGGMGAKAIQSYGKYLIPTAAALLAGGGLAVGKHLAQAQEDPLAAEEIKHQELMNEYDRLAKKVNTASKRRKLLENRG
jgi:hypothetical protein